MRLKNKIRSIGIRAMCSDTYQTLRRVWTELHRKISRRPHVVSVFVELDDPHSYLLASYLHEFRDHYNVELRLYLIEALHDAFRPAPQLYAEYALQDCRRLAKELGVPFLDRGDSPPVEQRRKLLDALALRSADEDFDDEIIQAITAYWRGDAEAVLRRAEEATGSGAAEPMLARNQLRLKRMGHYSSATMHYAGEWYWGVDRLHYLVDRLDALGVAREPGLAPRIASIRQVMQVTLPVRPPAAASQLPALEIFYSFRSPYSYISLTRVFAIADAFGIGIRIRPVMPMVLRGIPLPRAKQLYIVNDASREARRHRVPFGKVSDPLGPAVERCMAVFEYAQSERRERDFVLQAGKAIWSEAIDLGSDEGLRKVTGRVGLFWPDVLASLDDNAWRKHVEENRSALMALGLWGVPTLRVGDWVCWGQDRDWLLARHLEEMCDSGDGILI